jgi:hypothetical protein
VWSLCNENKSDLVGLEIPLLHGNERDHVSDTPVIMSLLQSTWTSAASEKQRRGRAGRCQPGVAMHLYSRSRAAQLAPFQLPELHRTNLDELCLQVRVNAVCASAVMWMVLLADTCTVERGSCRSYQKPSQPSPPNLSALCKPMVAAARRRRRLRCR